MEVSRRSGAHAALDRRPAAMRVAAGPEKTPVRLEHEIRGAIGEAVDATSRMTGVEKIDPDGYSSTSVAQLPLMLAHSRSAAEHSRTYCANVVPAGGSS
jgi:hypothetical protein